MFDSDGRIGNTGTIAPPQTFGNYTKCASACDASAGVVLLEHLLDSGAAYGVVDHFWAAGDASEAADEGLAVDYYVDGEATPSVSMTPAMACGQGFPQLNGSIGGDREQPLYGLFSAGNKMGRAARDGGWYHYHKVLFRTSIRIVARTSGPKVRFTVSVRGHEVVASSPAAEGLALPSGFVVPPQARLQLQRLDRIYFQPMAFAPLVHLPAGYAGLIYLTTVALDTSPSTNDYIEGCWHLYTDSNKTFPGIVVGTGVEDFFDSAYWFCALNGQAPCLFDHANAGLLHFSRKWGNGTAMSSEVQKLRPGPPGTHERLSAYRFFDGEVVGFSNGGALHWRVGDSPGKCNDPSDVPGGNVHEVSVHSYAWVYTWPLVDGSAPAPNAPPLQLPKRSAASDSDLAQRPDSDIVL